MTFTVFLATSDIEVESECEAHFVTLMYLIIFNTEHVSVLVLPTT